MEERTLEELNNEYKDLVEKVKGIKIELEKALATKEAADGNYEVASAEFTARKESYEALKTGLEKIGTTGFSAAIVESMKQDVAEAERKMNEAELALKVREQEQQKASEIFAKIEGDAKKESSRLDVILLSFGANETINKAISNEIEIDYSEMAEEKQRERTQIDELKTKISSDSKIQEQVGNLDELLKRFEELKKNVTPENANELAELGKQINSKRKSIRSSIRDRMKKSGLKGGKISVEEIDKMTTEKDAQGRMVIGELDRRTSVIDAEIANIQIEKKEILDKMAMALEAGRQNGQDSAEYLRLTAEIEGLKAEKTQLEGQQEESRKALEEIARKKEELNTELNSLGTSQVDQAKIIRLQQERASIEAEKVDRIENPEKASIRKQMEELRAQKAAGVPTDVETDEYKVAKVKYDAAVSNLDAEKQRPTVLFAAKTDEIIDNPEVTELKAKLSVSEKNLNGILNMVINANPELKQLNSDYVKGKEDEEKLNKDCQTAQGEVFKKREELVKLYVSDEIYPELTDENSEQAKAFEAYKQAELELRKAMLALQKDPSQENFDKLSEVRESFNATTVTLQDSLSFAKGTMSTPSPDAIHNYLLGKLKEAYDNFEPIDEAYDLNNAERRIAIIESKTKKDEQDAVNSLRDSSDALEDMLDNMLNGRVIDEGALADIVNAHQANLELFSDPDKVKSLLKGSDIDMPNVRFGFIRKIISSFRMPKVEERYYFPANKVPAEKAKYEEALANLDETTDRLLEVRQQKQQAREAFNAKFNEVATPEQKESLRKKQEEVAGIREKIGKLPDRINKTKLAKLEEAVRRAEEKLNGTQQYKTSTDTKDIEEQLAELTQKFNKEPDKIEDPAKAADKKRRLSEKEAEIQAAMADTGNPRRAEIMATLAELDSKEVNENANLEEKTSKLAAIVGTLREKGGILAALEVARQKIINLIHIKDANKMLDRRSGRIAEDLVNATRPIKTSKEDGERE